MISVGIDIGSLSTDAVVMQDDKVIGFSIVNTGANARDAAGRSLEQAMAAAGLRENDVEAVVATGYGRMNVSFANSQVTEITCHGRGAAWLSPGVRTVIDIGGQDSKAIRIDAKGNVVDFLMNDKCAAGTGRFLEVMAQRLELALEELGDDDQQAAATAQISSMCTVFAESEVVSLIAQGTPRPDIVRGLHNSIAERTAGLANRLGLKPEVMMTGGVAKNPGVVRALSEKLGFKIALPPEPQIVGAIGAALIARQKHARR